MKLLCKSLRVQKAGNSFNECEDWHCPPGNGKKEAYFELEPGFRANVALADGATEGMLSVNWAELLTKVFCRSGISDFTTYIMRVCHAWQGWLSDYLNKRKRFKPLEWYEEPGIQRGAFSTLLGISFVPPSESSHKWVSLAIGDSCVFQVRENQLIESFPVKAAEEFSNRPLLVNSKTPESSDPDLFYGEYSSGDLFFLATDALSEWFLKSWTEGKRPWDELLAFRPVESHKRFSDWLEALRCAKRIKNDDVTLIILNVS